MRQRLPRPTIFLARLRGGQWLRMSPETTSRIFEPFFTTKGKRDSGLGLSASHGIVTRHRGEIFVVSEPGEGTRFEVRLPTCEKNDKFVKKRKISTHYLSPPETPYLFYPRQFSCPKINHPGLRKDTGCIAGLCGHSAFWTRKRPEKRAQHPVLNSRNTRCSRKGVGINQLFKEALYGITKSR